MLEQVQKRGLGWPNVMVGAAGRSHGLFMETHILFLARQQGRRARGIQGGGSHATRGPRAGIRCWPRFHDDDDDKGTGDTWQTQKRRQPTAGNHMPVTTCSRLTWDAHGGTTTPETDTQQEDAATKRRLTDRELYSECLLVYPERRTGRRSGVSCDKSVFVSRRRAGNLEPARPKDQFGVAVSRGDSLSELNLIGTLGFEEEKVVTFASVISQFPRKRRRLFCFCLKVYLFVCARNVWREVGRTFLLEAQSNN